MANSIFVGGTGSFLTYLYSHFFGSVSSSCSHLTCLSPPSSGSSLISFSSSSFSFSSSFFTSSSFNSSFSSKSSHCYIYFLGTEQGCLTNTRTKILCMRFLCRELLVQSSFRHSSRDLLANRGQRAEVPSFLSRHTYAYYSAVCTRLMLK